MASIATMSNYNRIPDVAGGSTPKSIHMATLVLATVPVWCYIRSCKGTS